MHNVGRDGRERIVVAKLDFLNVSFECIRRLTDTETVSFSLTIGTTPMLSSSLNVFCALR